MSMLPILCDLFLQRCGSLLARYWSRAVAPEPMLFFGAIVKGCQGFRVYWVAVKALKLSYYLGETLLFTIYTHDGNLI